MITSAGWTRSWSVLCARLSTKSDLTVNCALSSSWLQLSITSASRCTNSTRSGRRRCDVELLEETSPWFDCASVCATSNLDNIWGNRDLAGLMSVKVAQLNLFSFRLYGYRIPVCAVLDISYAPAV